REHRVRRHGRRPHPGAAVTAALLQRFGLDGRTALVTGARDGIGRAAALALADAGADLVLWGHHDDLDDVAAEIEQRDRKVRTVAADVADSDAVHGVADQVLAAGPVDILVNNAGIIRRAPALATDFATWREVLQVNLDAVFLLCRLFGEPMRERGRGKIVNVASLLSFQGGLNVASYTATKHAVAGLTKALANEWAAGGV